MLTASDEHAGQVMKCPHCANTFTAPALPKVQPAGAAATSSVASQEAPLAASSAREGFVGSAPPSSAAPPESPPPGAVPPRPLTDHPAPTLLPGYQRTYTIWISPRVLPWFAPVCLVVVLILTFFTWLGILLSDSTRRSENAWEVAFGYSNAPLIVYLILFLLALLIAVASVLLPRLAINLPPAVQQIMPWRSGIVTGAIVLAFLFLFLQLVKGFNEEASELGALYVTRTAWLKLAVSLHLLAAVTAALEFWLVLRKTRPLPRVDISW
jgi:hypothetical protein